MGWANQKGHFTKINPLVGLVVEGRILVESLPQNGGLELLLRSRLPGEEGGASVFAIEVWERAWCRWPRAVS